MGGETTCPFCHAPLTSQNIKESGESGNMAASLMAIVATVEGQRGKQYIPFSEATEDTYPEQEVDRRLQKLLSEGDLEPLEERLPVRFSDGGQIHPYGFHRWRDIYTASLNFHARRSA